MPGWLECVFGLLLAARLVDAYTVFQLNCTAPTEEDHVNFVPSPSVRSTTDILWPSLSILLLCTWNAMHPIVPAHYEKKEEGWLGSVKAHARKIWARAKWMLIMVVMPEYMFGKAMQENFAANWSTKLFNHKRWTVAHGYMANMRGFVLSFEVRAVPTKLEPSETGDKASKKGLAVTQFSDDPEMPYVRQTQEKAIEIELQHCKEICRVDGVGPCRNHPDGPDLPPPASGVFAMRAAEYVMGIAMPGMKQNTPSSEKYLGTISDTFEEEEEHQIPKEIKGNVQGPPETTPALIKAHEELGPHKPWRGAWALTASQMYYAWKSGLIKVPSRVTVEAIKDRSKGDGLSKFIAILQITWMVIQIIARAAEGLAISLLEITVLAFATTAIAIYITVWHKPQNIGVPIVVEADRLMTREDVIELAARAPKSSMFVHEFWLHGVNVRTMAENIFPYAPGIPVKWPFGKDKDKPAKHYVPAVMIGIGLGGAIFGAVHCAAWDFHFPTWPEQLLWRIACLFIMSAPLPCAFFYVFTQHSAKVSKRRETWTHALMVPLYLMMPLYLLARMYLMVEALRALAFPVWTVFQTVNWPSMIPHIG